jgi:hypothetical protein
MNHHPRCGTDYSPPIRQLDIATLGKDCRACLIKKEQNVRHWEFADDNARGSTRPPLWFDRIPALKNRPTTPADQSHLHSIKDYTEYRESSLGWFMNTLTEIYKHCRITLHFMYFLCIFSLIRSTGSKENSWWRTIQAIASPAGQSTYSVDGWSRLLWYK